MALNLEATPAILVTEVADTNPDLSLKLGNLMSVYVPGKSEEESVSVQYMFQDRATARALASEVYEMRRRGLSVQEAVAEVEAAAEMDATDRYRSMTEDEKWEYWGAIMNSYAPQVPHAKEYMQQAITQRAQGVVLEAMCGFDTYIEDSPAIEQVIGLDRARSALARYRSDRTRVLFDLNSVNEDTGLDFLPDGSIDTISVTNGIHYLDNAEGVFKEFQRVLKPGGKLLIARALGVFSDLERPGLDSSVQVSLLEGVGFETSIERLRYHAGKGSIFFLIEAVNPRA